MNYMVVNTTDLSIDNIVLADDVEAVYVRDNQVALPAIAGAEIGAIVNKAMDAVVSKPAIVVPVPKSITRYQARVALRRAGLRDTVEKMIAQAGGDIKDAWDYAGVFERDSVFIVTMGAALGLTSKQIDDLFIMADTIT